MVLNNWNCPDWNLGSAVRGDIDGAANGYLSWGCIEGCCDCIDARNLQKSGRILRAMKSLIL